MGSMQPAGDFMYAGVKENEEHLLAYIRQGSVSSVKCPNCRKTVQVEADSSHGPCQCGFDVCFRCGRRYLKFFFKHSDKFGPWPCAALWSSTCTQRVWLTFFWLLAPFFIIIFTVIGLPLVVAFFGVYGLIAPILYYIILPVLAIPVTVIAVAFIIVLGFYPFCFALCFHWCFERNLQDRWNERRARVKRIFSGNPVERAAPAEDV